LRFGSSVNDINSKKYAAKLDFDRHEIFGIFELSLPLIDVAQK
jgi:hypothetical protein